MKFNTAIAFFLLSIPTLAQHQATDSECKGVVHGIVFGQNGQPVNAINVVLDPLGVGLSYVLPHVKTDLKGDYRFEKVCTGAYSVFARDEEAGYPSSSSYMNLFLYGTHIHEVKISKTNLSAELIVNLPPKPAQLEVLLTNSKTKAKIGRIEIELKVNRKRRVTTYCDESEFISCDEKPFFLVPPDQKVVVHVTSKGFFEWKESVGRGKLIRVPAGEVLTINTELDPIKN